MGKADILQVTLFPGFLGSLVDNWGCVCLFCLVRVPNPDDSLVSLCKLGSVNVLMSGGALLRSVMYVYICIYLYTYAL